jgi:hephaestin
MYHSHVDEVRDVFSGLIGPLIITAREHALPDGRPADVDREFVLMFAMTHEQISWYARRNITPELDEAQPPPGPNLLVFPYSVKFSINGYTHGGLPLETMTMQRDERVRWYVFASTADIDFHTPHWHGQTVVIGGMRTDVAALEPMEMVVADMVPDNVGTWLIHCHVADHLLSGMQARFRVVE